MRRKQTKKGKTMKVKCKVINAISETRKFRDNKTGNEQVRRQATLACQTAYGELLTVVVYLDATEDVQLPKFGEQVNVNLYRYEAQNALSGSGTARTWELCK